MTNYIEKLKELRDKASPDWRIENVYAVTPEGVNDEDCELIIAMKNSLDLWLELAEAVEKSIPSISPLVRKDRKYPFDDILEVLAKLRGETK